MNTKKEVEPVEEAPEVNEEEVKAEVEKAVGAIVGTKVAEALEAYKKEQAELNEKRAGLMNPVVKASREELNARTRTFLKALTINDVAVLKDMSTSDSAGGYTIDRELVAEIQHLMTEYGVSRREMYSTPVSKGSIDINNLATDVSVYWTDEAVAKTSSDVVLGQVSLTLKKLAVIVPMTDELLDDTEIDLVGFLIGRIAEGFAYQEDFQFFNGSGAPFVGLLNNANVNEVVIDVGVQIDDVEIADYLLDMQDATPQGALRNGKYYMHRSIKNLFRKLKDDQGRYIFSIDSGVETIWGRPVVEVEAMPAVGDVTDDMPIALFGDLKKAAWLGYKGGLVTYIAKEGVVRNTDGNDDLNLLRQDMTALRVVERVGYVAVIPTAVTKLTTAPASV